jgi:hypothetical protein
LAFYIIRLNWSTKINPALEDFLKHREIGRVSIIAVQLLLLTGRCDVYIAVICIKIDEYCPNYYAKIRKFANNQ